MECGSYNGLKSTIGCPHCSGYTSSGPVQPKEYKLGRRIVNVQGHEDIALDYLTKVLKIKPNKIQVGLDGKVPVIDYYFEGIKRKHYPDIFIPDQNKIIEVKGTWTFGMEHARDTEPSRTFYKNQEKLKAARKLGFEYEMMVFSQGNLVELPKYWYNKSWETIKAKYFS